MTNNPFLPNGTIVLLKGSSKKLMIYGRKQLKLDDEQMFDYLAVPYPEGYISPEFTYVFNRSDIEEIIFLGFDNEEEQAFQSILLQAVNN
ncbi:MAG: DUF4176 domain-containing protein [Bacillus sp. (in: firmicutes)]